MSTAVHPPAAVAEISEKPPIATSAKRGSRLWVKITIAALGSFAGWQILG